MYSKKDTIIFIGGESPAKSIINQLMSDIFFNPCIIAADSGFFTAKEYNVPVHILIGDMDSVGYPAVKIISDRIKIFPENKDYTDTELALIEAKNYQAKRIILIGGSGGRFDHVLSLRSLYERSTTLIPYPDVWFCGNNYICCLDSEKKEKIKIENLSTNDYISVFPINIENCNHRIQAHGLKWNISNLDWRTTGGSVSNKPEKSDEDVFIEAQEGRFLIVIPLTSFSKFTVY